MDENIKKKIQKIIALAQAKNQLNQELNELDDYKNKITKIREKYASKKS